MKKLILIIFSVLVSFFSFGKNKKFNLSPKQYQIKVIARNYSSNDLQLAYPLNNKHYLVENSSTGKDSFVKEVDGAFTLNSETPFQPGIYSLVFKPNNNTFEILITENNQNIEISLDYNNIIETISFKDDSNESTLFLDYQKFIFSKKEEQKEAYNNDDSSIKEELNNQVVAYQKNIIKNHPNSFLAVIIKANLPLIEPEFKGLEAEIQKQKWEYYKNHYFDNINLVDSRLLRTPFFYNKVEDYLDKLTVQHPDSIITAVDLLLNKMKPSKENFKNFTVIFLNKYAKSKIVGMDAVYVHIVNNYYATGDADWIEQEQLNKILENANTLKPILIGKVAPNLSLEATNGIKFNLHELKNKYTVLYFLKSDCLNCKKSNNLDLISDYEKLKNLGAELIAVCFGDVEGAKKCTDAAKASKIKNWLHVKLAIDQETALKNYNLTFYPSVFVLDNNKKIISKRIGLDQLTEVIKE